MNTAQAAAPPEAGGADPVAALAQPSPLRLELSGAWTARGLGELPARLAAVQMPAGAAVLDANAVQALDSAGAWLLHRLLERLRAGGTEPTLQALAPALARRLELVAQACRDAVPVLASPPGNVVHQLGRHSVAAAEEALAMLAFIGESAAALAGCVLRPARLRVRPVLHNIRSAGVDALPIVGLLAFMLGVVVAYQGAEQLRNYGANIFVADLVGVSMLREFAPLITAIIVAGRSGSAYAAQIGTMSVTEEIDALRTLGIVPQELLVLPKLLALLVAMPLLTVFADLLGVAGGMLMARAQLDVGFGSFADRLLKATSMTTLFLGLAKAPVFAVIIAMVGCFQGFRTRGGADAVGRQTTRSVVQSIFLVIVADALFSVAFSALRL